MLHGVKKVVAALVVCAVLAVPAAAQNNNLSIERNNNKSVSLRLRDKRNPGTTTVLMKVSRIDNCNVPTHCICRRSPSGDIFRFYVHGNNSKFLTLTPVDKSRNVVFSVDGYRMVYGAVDAHVDTAFVYRMPCTVCRPVGVSNVGHNDKGIVFGTEAGDTIYAMRRGVVKKIESVRSSVSRQVLVEHADGSLAEYFGFADGKKPFVAVGDYVMPGDPMGVTGVGKHGSGKIRVRLFRLCTDSDNRDGIFEYPDVKRVGVPMTFATSDGNIKIVGDGLYTAVMDDSLYTREMTKKEQKRRTRNKK